MSAYGLPNLSRRAITAFSLAALPVTATAKDASLAVAPAEFARDLIRSYEQQVIGLDMQGVNKVFTCIRNAELGVGFAHGSDRGTVAAQVAVLALNRVGMHTLVVVACGLGSPVLFESKRAYNVVRAAGPESGLFIYAVCRDALLSTDSLRVSVLTG